MNNHEKMETLYNLVDQLPRKGGQVPEDEIERALILIGYLRAAANMEAARAKWKKSEGETNGR